MNFVSPDSSGDALGLAIEANAMECCKGWGKWEGLELHDDPDMMWSVSDIPFPYFNNVFGARMDPRFLDRDIDRVLERFQARNVPMFWWTGPTSRPPELESGLRDRGLSAVFTAVGMAAGLDIIGDDQPAAGNLSLTEVGDLETLSAWCRVMTSVYEFPEFAAGKWQQLLASLELGSDRPYRHFLAFLEGRPVATASLFLGAGVAGISSVATLPGARNLGIGTAVTRRALHAGKNAGYSVATLFSSPMGLGMYRRLGFEQYCEGRCYAWPAG